MSYEPYPLPNPMPPKAKEVWIEFGVTGPIQSTDGRWFKSIRLADVTDVERSDSHGGCIICAAVLSDDGVDLITFDGTPDFEDVWVALVEAGIETDPEQEAFKQIISAAQTACAEANRSQAHVAAAIIARYWDRGEGKMFAEWDTMAAQMRAAGFDRATALLAMTCLCSRNPADLIEEIDPVSEAERWVNIAWKEQDQ